MAVVVLEPEPPLRLSYADAHRFTGFGLGPRLRFGQTGVKPFPVPGPKPLGPRRRREVGGRRSLRPTRRRSLAATRPIQGSVSLFPRGGVPRAGATPPLSP